MDDARRASLLDERDFLLRSLDDLDREYAAGDVDDHDYRTLRDDYTARAAAVIRALEADTSPSRRPASRRRWQRLGWAGLVAVLAATSGVLVAQASGSRSGEDPLTGLDVRGEFSRLEECTALDTGGVYADAIECYDDLVAAGTENHQVYLGRGWLQVRTGIARTRDESADQDAAADLIAAGIDDLTEATLLAPRASEPLLFRAIGRFRSPTPDPLGALADLVVWDSNGPTDEERTIAAGFVPAVLDEAVATCIELDVAGDDGTLVLGCYTDVLRLDPEHPLANLYLGFLLGKAGVLDLALEHLDRGLAADPGATQGYVFRAAVRASAGDLDGAAADLDRFDTFETPADQRAAADAVRAALSAGEDPLS